MLCDSIRRHGLSDSAAAEQQGMSTSTLSRWKQLFPEIRIKLKQARQEIRTFHLQKIMDHAAAEDGKGWRASAWILERLFPGDYSPRMKERLSYLNLEDRLRDQEAHEALDERLRELHEMQAEERAARAAAQAAEAAAAEEVRSEVAPADSGPVVSHGPAARPGERKRGGRRWIGPSFGWRRADRPQGRGDNRSSRRTRFLSEGDSHNSRNSGEVEVQDAPVAATGLWPVPASASELRGAKLDDVSDGGAQTAHRAVATTGAREERFYSEGDSHNSRNSAEVEVPGRSGCSHGPVARPGERKRAAAALD